MLVWETFIYDIGMLSKSSANDLIMIVEIGKEVWGDSCHFENLNWVRDGMPGFNLPIILYGSIKVELDYDRGTLDYCIYTPEGMKTIGQLTKDEMFGSFSVFESPDNLRHNFKVLDRAVCRIFGLSGTAELDNGFASALDE